MIRILSIEDHWLFSEGLRSKFRGERSGISIKCIAENIEDGLETDPSLFDIILLDLLLPGTRPEDNIRKLKEKFPSKPIIILTSEERSFWEYEMSKAGVKAFLTKHDDRKVVKDVIIKVYEGVDFLKQREPKNTDIHDAYDQWENYLKPKEKEILTLFSKDLSINEISKRMSVSQSGISKVMTKLRKQFQVKTNARLLFLLKDKL